MRVSIYFAIYAFQIFIGFCYEKLELNFWRPKRTRGIKQVPLPSPWTILHNTPKTRAIKSTVCPKRTALADCVEPRLDHLEIKESRLLSRKQIHLLFPRKHSTRYQTSGPGSLALRLLITAPSCHLIWSQKPPLTRPIKLLAKRKLELPRRRETQ
jgi:hypothetical protein